MSNQTTVTVQNIKNPAVTRQMTVNSAKMNSRKWKIIDAVEETVKKKEVVNPAVGRAEVAPENGGFAKIETVTDEKTVLQAEYEAKSGKKPDGRWSEAKLKEKINELNTDTHETA